MMKGQLNSENLEVTGEHASLHCTACVFCMLLVCQQVIITTNNVLVMNPEDENVLPFITELKMKISQPSGLAGVHMQVNSVWGFVLHGCAATSLQCLLAGSAYYLQPSPQGLQVMHVCVGWVASFSISNGGHSKQFQHCM